MRLIDRFLSGFTIFSILLSYNMIGGITIAEEIDAKNVTNVAKGSNVAEEDPIAEETIDLNVNIPEQWSNNFDSWEIITDDDVDLYYKTSAVPMNEDEWGSYADRNAKQWNDGIDFDDGEGFIKFWAVKMIGDEEKVVTQDALHFMYDKTSPNELSLEKVEAGDNEFVIRNTYPIYDNLSGIDKALYIIDPENVQTTDDIHNLGIEIELEITEDGISFEIPCIKEMNGNTVTVYVIDRAGNIQYSSIGVDTYKDLSAPTLIVNGIKTDQWVNSLEDWDIHSNSVGAKIYFKTADSDLEDWGIYTDSDVEEWTDNTMIPEGDRFIHFWAAYDDYERECSEKTIEYKFDATPPDDFSIKYKHEGGHWDSISGWNEPSFIVYGTGISDKTSGINQERIYYMVKQNGREWEQGTVESKNLVIDDDTISFTIDLSKDEWLNNVNVTFYIVDNAGNETSCILDEEALSYDPSAPVIVTGKEAVCITSRADENAQPLDFFSYGAKELENNWNSVYANSDCYLKITIKDSNLQQIVVTVDDKKSVTFTNDGKDNTPKWECLDSDKSNDAKVYFIKLSDIGMSENQKHSLSMVAKDSQNSSNKITLTNQIDDTEVGYTVFYDPYDDEDSKIKFQSKNSRNINNKNYYGRDFRDDIMISMDDDNGIKSYSVEIAGPEGFNINTGLVDISEGEKNNKTYEKEVEVTNAGGRPVKDEDGNIQTISNSELISYMTPYKHALYKISLDNTVYKYDGKYIINVQVEDLAGNTRIDSYEFYVDTTSPSIINESYTYNPSVLNYLSFGIFGNNTLDIVIEVDDNETGCGIDSNSVLLYWGDNKVEGKLTEKEGAKEFTFEKLPVGRADIPYITLKDILGNTANYFFTTEDGKLGDKNNITETYLILESIKPIAEIILPEENQYSINGEVWYPSGFDYSVTAKDENSGLNNISVIEGIINNDDLVETKSKITENGIIVDDNYDKFVDMEERFTKEAKYQYHINDEGNYQLTVDAQDNAGNKSSDDPNNIKSLNKIVHIDKTNPEIIEFQFNDQDDNGADVEQGTYGFYFMDDTKVRVFVKDDGNSSGINYVTLYRKDVNEQEKSVKVYSSDADYHVENGVAYAEFTIEKGFKGQIWALVADNVVSENPFEDEFRHTSGLRYADGSIVEDAELHNSVSSITISENINTNKFDPNGIPLYNISVPFTINVQDTFSGISTIEWSIANDGSSGIITVANDGSYQSNSELVSIVEDSISEDANLITNLSFSITATSNTNGNVVSVKLIDRSGNESVAAKQFSIDTKNPTITASLSNQVPINVMYYNTDQTVTISITERNFDASNVSFMLNGSEQVIDNWTAIEEGDDTIHTGTFNINSDGDYSYSITFTDMAGNAAEPFNQSRFVVDKTAPVLKTNFDEFNTSEEEHYFGVDSINKTAKITIIEHNFSTDGANVEIMKKEAGLEHNTNSMKLSSSYGWKDDGDTHTLEIPFKENDDGIYFIRVSPVDLASNSTPSQETVVFEIDFTNPIISERNGIYVRNEDKSYENLEIYNEKTGLEANFIPSIGFSDTNFDHIEYDLTFYTPEYTNGKEIGVIEPNSYNGSITEKIYTLPEFKKDGVYSVELTAIDKAGNRSILCKNTSVLMMNTNVLAYISNSNKSELKGWYSLQKDENTPISKRPDSFSDLSITVFAQVDSKTSIILRDENGESKNTGITAENDEDMYAVGVYNYILPKEYFLDNYPEGTNKDLYLWVENTINKETSHITLGWIRIDALAPTCSIPDDLKSWKSYINTTKTITLSNISESLNESQCVVYDNRKAVSQDNFDYSDEKDTLSYTLEKGWHDLSFVLVDEAGNTYTIQEISSIQVGLSYCLWFWILCGIIVVAVISATIFIIKKKKSVYTPPQEPSQPGIETLLKAEKQLHRR